MFNASVTESPRTPPLPVIRPAPKSNARPENARSPPCLDSVSGCSSARRSPPKDPASRLRRSSARPGSSAPSPAKATVSGWPFASPWNTKRPGRGASRLRVAAVSSLAPKLALLSDRRALPEGARKMSAKRAVTARRPAAIREGPEPAASLVPLAETSTSCPPRPSQFGAGSGELGAVDVAVDPQMIERSREIELCRDRPRQIGAECRSERLQMRQLDSERPGQLVRCGEKPRVAGEAEGCPGDGQPVEGQDIGIVAFDCAGNGCVAAQQRVGGSDPGPQFFRRAGHRRGESGGAFALGVRFELDRAGQRMAGKTGKGAKIGNRPTGAALDRSRFRHLPGTGERNAGARSGEPGESLGAP